MHRIILLSKLLSKLVVMTFSYTLIITLCLLFVNTFTAFFLQKNTQIQLFQIVENRQIDTDKKKRETAHDLFPALIFT